jgi:hypothetical protein
MMLEQAAGYTIPADSAQLEALAARLRERNFEVRVVADAVGAKAAVLELLPQGALRPGGWPGGQRGLASSSASQSAACGRHR